MREDKAIEKWCPFSHVSVQRVQKNDLTPIVAVGPGFNRTTLGTWPDYPAAEAASCLGADCACWRPSSWNLLLMIPFVGYFYRKRGKCGLGS